MVKSGLKTHEFILTAITLGLGFIGQYFGTWEVPTEAFLAIATWALGRGYEKLRSPTGESGKPAWKTSEFWVTLLYSGVATTFPELPFESVTVVAGYVGSRVYAKKNTPLGSAK